MKKVLFLIMTVALCTALQAQPTYHPEWVGYTQYVLPTNSNARNTISFRPNSQDAAVVWTTATNSSPTRGTGINYYDIANRIWGDVMFADVRIETERTGWGTHGFTSQGEIVVSHNSNADTTGGLVVCTRDNWGTGNWNEYVLKCTPYIMSTDLGGHNTYETTCLIWPTMVTNGDIVHLVAVTAQWPLERDCDPYPHGYFVDGKNYPTVPLYYRSSDGGKTWDIKEVNFLDNGGMTEFELSQISSDSYVLAVRDNHVVLLYESRGGFINYMESLDNGETWNKVTVYECEDFFTNSPAADLPYRLMPSTSAIYIDENHKVHVAFGTNITYKPKDDCSTVILSDVPSGIVYWNSDHEPIKWEDLAAVDLDDNPFGTQHKWYSYPYYIDLPSVLGFERHNAFYDWDVKRPAYSYGNQFRGKGWMIYPRIIAQNGRVYISYQAPLEWPVTSTDQELYFRGIFVTVSEDGGATWEVQNNTSWVSYHPELYNIDWCDYPGPINIDATPDQLRAWAQTITHITTTECAYPTMSTNTKDWFLLLQWYSQESPHLDYPHFSENAVLVYTFHQFLWRLPQDNNIQYIRRPHWTDCLTVKNIQPAINVKIYPNPAINEKVYVEVDTDIPYTLTVTNIMGQVLHTINRAQNTVAFDVSNFAPGIYIVNVRTDRAVASQKLILR
ncbi:MAG: T9SS type A sorting domain-containing protein [Lentimicrobiaceae bacterium]|nr:T9SS type A sorting domain-containing protein [Lentimicrobiaceae bacterium]